MTFRHICYFHLSGRGFAVFAKFDIVPETSLRSSIKLSLICGYFRQISNSHPWIEVFASFSWLAIFVTFTILPEKSLVPSFKKSVNPYWFFLPDSKFSPLLKGFLPIVHFSREISPSINKISVNLCVIFPNICHFHLSCQVLSVFANSPFDRGHRTAPPFHIPRTFCDLSPILSFSRCLSDFCPFSQIVI